MESRTFEVDGIPLHVGVTGSGPDVVVLTGGPGCVQYLELDSISPAGHRAWYPEPRGVGRSQGAPHTMERAIADLEGIRQAIGLERWIVSAIRGAATSRSGTPWNTPAPSRP